VGISSSMLGRRTTSRAARPGLAPAWQSICAAAWRLRIITWAWRSAVIVNCAVAEYFLDDFQIEAVELTRSNAHA